MRASCPRWTVLAASRVKVAADGVELIWGEGRFDPPEDRSLFVANVLTEQLAEFVEDFGFRVWRAVELGDAATDVRVLGQDALDVRVVRAGVFARAGRSSSSSRRKCSLHSELQKASVACLTVPV